jgi:uncharacterized coiled-coil protein SlyX
MKNKTAKDLAFDRERAKYGKRIKELEVELKRKDGEILELRNQVSEAEAKCESLQDWIDRLLEYTEMSEDDMKKIIQKDKDSAEVMERMNALLGITKMFGNYIY